jgi:hypothetical protein
MPSTQKAQVCLDEKKADQNQAVSAKKAHIKEVDPITNITIPKGGGSVKNSSRQLKWCRSAVKNCEVLDQDDGV